MDLFLRTMTTLPPAQSKLDTLIYNYRSMHDPDMFIIKHEEEPTL